MTVMAFVATRLADADFNKDNKTHLMLNDMYLGNEIKAVTQKYMIGRRKLVLSLAQLAYESVDVAMENGIVSATSLLSSDKTDQSQTKDTIMRVMAHYLRNEGESFTQCLARVVREDAKAAQDNAEAQNTHEKNMWEVYGIIPKPHIRSSRQRCSDVVIPIIMANQTWWMRLTFRIAIITYYRILPHYWRRFHGDIIGEVTNGFGYYVSS